MSNKKRCFYVHSKSSCVFDLDDDPTGIKLETLGAVIKNWSKTAIEGTSFTLRAKRFTQEELDCMEEFSYE